MTFERFGLIVTTTALLALGSLRCLGVTGNLTNSEPVGLYIHTYQAPKRGSLIMTRPMVKHIAGAPGDTVTATPQGSWINGKLWPNSGIPADTHGYQPFRFGTYVLQPGQYWLLGTNPDSLDSRYLGMLSADLINFTIQPLWTQTRR